MVHPSLVSVVDDDESVRESLPDLLRVLGFAVEAFSSAEEFLASPSLRQTRCVILDIAMPGMSGYDLERALRRREHDIPIVFISAHEDEIRRERAPKAGVIDRLPKPFSDAELLNALNSAFQTKPSAMKRPADAVNP